MAVHPGGSMEVSTARGRSVADTGSLCATAFRVPGTLLLGERISAALWISDAPKAALADPRHDPSTAQ